jgi:hypothetical protein
LNLQPLPIRKCGPWTNGSSCVFFQSHCSCQWCSAVSAQAHLVH